jgi:hypothetical protein
MPAKKQTKPEQQADDMMTPAETNTEKSPMLQLGGLWINESLSGKGKYMTGYLGNLKIMVFRNNFKTEDKHPDYVMYLTEKKRDTEENGGQEPDDIPF